MSRWNESAIVEAGAALGDGTCVWHHAQVREGSVVGRDCTLSKKVFVDKDVRIGDRVRIQNNVSVYAGVTLADDVFVGPSAVFTNDRHPRSHGSAGELASTLVRRARRSARTRYLCARSRSASGQWWAPARS
jgi:UDP-2-acetamido-3-amino-2,3-dideoxy-glucuronate N-acetyltransferase